MEMSIDNNILYDYLIVFFGSIEIFEIKSKFKTSHLAFCSSTVEASDML